MKLEFGNPRQIKAVREYEDKLEFKRIITRKSLARVLCGHCGFPMKPVAFSIRQQVVKWGCGRRECPDKKREVFTNLIGKKLSNYYVNLIPYKKA
jgi:hypothetical protein